MKYGRNDITSKGAWSGSLKIFLTHTSSFVFLINCPDSEVAM